MINIIFLDFDGPVNSLLWMEREGRPLRPGLNYPDDLRVNNSQAIYWLNELCRVTDSKIVITSAWRYFSISTEQCLRNSGLCENIEILGETPKLETHRGNEIDVWLDQYTETNNITKNDVNFIIIDDDSDMDPYMDRLVRCNIHYGFTGLEYGQALELLMSPKKEEITIVEDQPHIKQLKPQI